MSIKTLKDGTTWTKAEYWNGKDLKGEWQASIKIDGVRCIRGADGKMYSRDSKPIMHTECCPYNDAEFFYRNWNTSISILHTEKETEKVIPNWFYSLDPLDLRLDLGKYTNPNAITINALMEDVLAQGYEGVVLRQGAKWIKVVPTKYADVRIVDIKEGHGKYDGMAGSIITTCGSVGSFEYQGMPDPEFRKELLEHKDQYLGKIIQVAYREFTPNRVFKFPRMVRIRIDKEYEDLPE